MSFYNEEIAKIQIFGDTKQEQIVKLQKENEELKKVKEQSQQILSSIKIIYSIHTKDCELTLKDIKKWEKILDK